jgi:3-dehydroquinate synthase
MAFEVNNTQFNIDINLRDNLKIKSYKNDYEVFYINKSLINLVSDIYLENDFIFIDRNVYNLDIKCLDNIDSKLYYIFDAIENNKTIDTVLEIIDILYNLNFNKKNKLIIIGGGITQDVGGFIASLYKRGISWTYIPTTFLSIVDSAIGAKVSLNRKSKNMLGVFYAPTNIYISEFFLNSLKDDDIKSGLGEALKLSLIGGDICFNMFLENYKDNNYINIIKISSLVKKTIIEYDELEHNERKVLNYGHEFAHALEEASHYFIPHGIAVLFGMYMVNKLFYKNKYSTINTLILEIIPDKYKLLNLSYDIFIKHLLNDKKNIGNKICIILLDNIGKSIFIYKTLSEIDTDMHIVFNNIFKV